MKVKLINFKYYMYYIYIYIILIIQKKRYEENKAMIDLEKI